VAHLIQQQCPTYRFLKTPYTFFHARQSAGFYAEQLLGLKGLRYAAQAMATNGLLTLRGNGVQMSR
jgi:hypothetical protein